MTDFRALCADLLDEVVARPLLLDRELITRARAALADEPAVPEGRESVAVTGQPSDEELARLWFETDGRAVLGAKEYARAVLARWGNPAPQPPADGEVAELVEELRLISDGMSAIGHDSDSWFVARAAKLLQRQTLVPVPVSERLPGLEDCDAEGRCWFIRFPFDYSRESWSLETRTYGCNIGFTHWLPAHALPIPQQQQETTNG